MDDAIAPTRQPTTREKRKLLGGRKQRKADRNKDLKLKKVRKK